MFRKPSARTWFALLLIVAVALALLLPPSSGTLHSLHISVAAYKASVLTLVVPYGVIWFSAFYAYDKLQAYARKVRGSTEGRHFKLVADGVRILAWGLALQVILSLLLNAFADAHSDLKGGVTVLNHYIVVAISLLGFTYIAAGTRALTDIVRVRPGYAAAHALALVFIAFGVLFAHLAIRNSSGTASLYNLPVYPLIFTVIVPYLYVWFLGFMSAWELQLYARWVKGVLFRQALRKLAGGIAIVIAASIAVQFLTGVYTGGIAESLGSLLVIIYILLTIQAVGYVLIAFGAKQLKKIEEV